MGRLTSLRWLVACPRLELVSEMARVSCSAARWRRAWFDSLLIRVSWHNCRNGKFVHLCDIVGIEVSSLCSCVLFLTIVIVTWANRFLGSDRTRMLHRQQGQVTAFLRSPPTSPQPPNRTSANADSPVAMLEDAGPRQVCPLQPLKYATR